jgi:glycosyltransferase involved in cell wall biosynthesis
MRSETLALSVCVPAFNGAPYIGAALTSVLAQTFGDFELLVVDDGSTDGTREVVEGLRDARLRVIGHRFRLGLVANWNRCLELSRGRYVTVFHQDDLMAPDNLEEKVRFLDTERGVGFVHSAVEQIDADGGLVSTSWSDPPGPDHEGRHEGIAYFRRLVSGANVVCAPSVVMRRAAVERVGGFDPRLPFTADWEMWLRLALFHDVGYVARPLVRYRRHHAMETEQSPWSRHLEQGYLAKVLALDKHGDRVPDAEAVRRRVVRDYRERALDRMRQALAASDLATAGEYLAVAARVCTRNGRAAGEDLTALREIFDGLGGKPGGADAATRLADAEVRIRQLAHEVEDHERLIEAMMRTRAWRAAERWWSLKRALTGRFRR